VEKEEEDEGEVLVRHGTGVRFVLFQSTSPIRLFPMEKEEEGGYARRNAEGNRWGKQRREEGHPF